MSQTSGHGLVLVSALLGIRPHRRRWAAGEQAKLHRIYSCSPLLSLPHYHNVLIIETKCTINNALESSWNHPPPPPPWSMEKLPSTKLAPGARKVGDHWFKARWIVHGWIDLEKEGRWQLGWVSWHSDERSSWVDPSSCEQVSSAAKTKGKVSHDLWGTFQGLGEQQWAN